MKQLFAKKSLQKLLDEMHGDNRLRRVLGPFSLMSLGIGAIIGTGIFVMTGLGARNYAGPGIVMSYVFAGLACAFAALCYAEFAAMAPVAGSAYTYAYTTLGELVAWIIGWDLVLEYAMGSSVVARGWAAYFFKLVGLFKNTWLAGVFLAIPPWLTSDTITIGHQYADYQAAQTLVVAKAIGTPTTNLGQLSLPVAMDAGITRLAKVDVTFSEESLGKTRALLAGRADDSIKRVLRSVAGQLETNPTAEPAAILLEVAGENKSGYDAYQNSPLRIGGTPLAFNIVSFAIIAAITVVLVLGIRESASFNTAMVVVKLGAVLFVIFFGAQYVDAKNWTPFLPYGWGGVVTGAGVIFFAYIGFDSISTHSEEAKNPQRDVPIGIIGSLAICTLLYILVALVITGMVPFQQIDIHAPIAAAFESRGLKVATSIITIAALTGMTSVLLVMLLSQPRVLLAMARDGLLPQSFFGAVHPVFRTPHKATILTGIVSGLTSSCFPLEALEHMVNVGTLFAFVVVCGSVLLMRIAQPDLKRPFRAPALFFVAPAGVVLCGWMMIALGNQDAMNWVRLFGWMLAGLAIYFTYGVHHSILGKELRGESKAG